MRERGRQREKRERHRYIEYRREREVVAGEKCFFREIKRFEI